MKRRAGGRRPGLSSAPVDGVDLVVLCFGFMVMSAVFAWGIVGPSRQAAVAGDRAPVAVVPNRPTVDVIVGGTTQGREWIASIGDRVDAKVEMLAGDGFTKSSASFAAVAKRVDPHAAVVVILTPKESGSTGPIDLGTRIITTVAAVMDRDPQAHVLLVGPILPSTQATQTKALRGVVRNAAKASSSTWTDPVANDWISVGQLGSDGVLTAAGGDAASAELAEQVSPLLGE